MKDQKYRDTQRDICTRFCISFLFDHSNNFVFCSIELQFNWVLEQFWMNENLYSITLILFFFFEGEILWSPESVFLPPFHLFESFLSHFSHVLHLFFPHKAKIACLGECILFPVSPFFRERGEFLDLKRCQYLTSEDFCSLTAQQIEAIIDTPIPETW